jgi:ferredoxin
MPAIHKTKEEIAKLFAEKVPGVEYTDNVDALIQIGRKVLREKFLEADIGLSGVNFAVAETGTLCLVENEGNGRMCTTAPPIHIAITGIEKIVEQLEHVPPLLSLLTRSATGQNISTYFNMISSPRKPGEKDGPEEVHLVLLDNGRSQAYADEQLRKTLQCIRCGACMNHCPVYTRIGGHAYGTTYPGPIGKIISPHMLGLEATATMATASSLCGACGEVCPVKIPIPELLMRLREESFSAPHANPDPAMRGQGQGAGYSPFDFRDMARLGGGLSLAIAVPDGDLAGQPAGAWWLAAIPRQGAGPRFACHCGRHRSDCGICFGNEFRRADGRLFLPTPAPGAKITKINRDSTPKNEPTNPAPPPAPPGKPGHHR